MKISKTHNLITAALLACLVILPGLSNASTPDAKDWKFAVSLYADTKASSVGDLLTVTIEEQSETTKSAKSASSKSSSMKGSMSIAHPTMDSQGTPWTNATLPAYNISANRSFEGGGSTENKDRLMSTMAVRVMEVLPNKNLLVEGKRTVTVHDEKVIIVLTGTVRPQDISRDNVVKSSDIADAAIRYMTSGPITKNQKRGIITSLWNWINPF